MNGGTDPAVTSTLHLEDLAPGRQFTAGPLTVSADEIIAFARQFDPQPFHTDPDAALTHPMFRGLAASGWHTAALTMRLVVEALQGLPWGVVGGGGELQWTRPVRPGDALSVLTEVVSVHPSTTRPERGTAVMRNTTSNAAGEPVQIFTVRIHVPTRPSGTA